MTKEELFKLLHQVKKDREIVITWLTKDDNVLHVELVGDIKDNLSRNRVEISLYGC